MIEEEEIVDVKFSAYESDYLCFMEQCEEYEYDETELFNRMLLWWLGEGGE